MLRYIASCPLGTAQHSVDVSPGFVDSIYVAYTTQTNIWATAVCLVLLSINLFTGCRRGVPWYLHVLKYMAVPPFS